MTKTISGLCKIFVRFLLLCPGDSFYIVLCRIRYDARNDCTSTSPWFLRLSVCLRSSKQGRSRRGERCGKRVDLKDLLEYIISHTDNYLKYSHAETG